MGIRQRGRGVGN